MKNKAFYIILLVCILFVSCKKDNQGPVEDGDVNAGGSTTVDVSFVNTFQQPAPNLTAAEIELHRQGDLAFGDIFVTAPSVVNSGLGPVFNQNSCESCHVSNGKSSFPLSTDNTKGLLIRLSMPGTGAHGGPLPVPGFGGQLQTKAVYGKTAEAQLNWQEIEEIKSFVDGEIYALRRFEFSYNNPYIPWPTGVLTSPRIAPAIIGLGLLEAISEADLLANADPDDKNADGISGRPNYGWNEQTQQKQIGRFGWKAAQPTLIQQSAAAYNNDMGITNPIFTKESSFGQLQYDKLNDDPEIDMNTLKVAAFYTQSLGVPKRRNWADAEVRQGKTLFTKIQCDACHKPKFVTGQHPEYPFLSNQTIYPYTDLLLHDMGEALADNRPDFEASGREWRTPPLWGIGLTKTVGSHTNFLHDGRARNLEEAILWHGGEAEKSKEAFRKMSKTERTTLIRFIESL